MEEMAMRRRDKYMHMIVHDDEGVQLVAWPREVLQCPSHDIAL